MIIFAIALAIITGALALALFAALPRMVGATVSALCRNLEKRP